MIEKNSLKSNTAIAALLLLAGCESSSSGNSSTTGESLDISGAIFESRSADCADYVNSYAASALDIQNSTSFSADVVITATDATCTIVSNSVPNHDFNDESAAFAGGAEGATISEIDSTLTVTRNPSIAAEATALSQEIKNGVFLNGVRLDIISAGCYRPDDTGADQNGDVGIGCGSSADWLLDPLSTTAKFGADLHNAHTQPEGLYHYHGNPKAMFADDVSYGASPVIGFAADGFPIFGSYFYDSETGSVRKAESGYTLKSGSREQEGTAITPPGDYSGRYNQDWEFTDAGDLDACNGMTVDGQYGYYVIDAYPWVMGCISGTPDTSFGTAGDGTDRPPPPGA